MSPGGSNPPTSAGWSEALPRHLAGWDPRAGLAWLQVQIPFAASSRASLGIEWELELIDLQTRELASAASQVLAEVGIGHPEGGHPKAKHELLESTIEVITGVCTTVAEATSDLAQSVAEISSVTDGLGLALMCSGTHPFTDWSTQQVSNEPRYRKLVAQMQWLARRLQIFGVHVHVGVRARDKAIPIVNALTAYIPHLLSLSASSPYWMGTDTGLASARSKVFEGLPTAGLPYQLSGWEQFESYIETLISTGTIETIREVWWDIRPHPNFGTVELRIFDGLPTLSEVGTVAALAQCLVEQFDLQLDRGYTLPVPKSWTVRENKWRAARYGLEAQIIDDRGQTAPVRGSLSELAAELAPLADRLGCSKELARIDDIVRQGASYQRQRQVAAAHDGDLRAVVDALVVEMRTGSPVYVDRHSP